MGDRIPLEVIPAREIEIDAAIVAQAFDVDLATFRELMHRQQIATLCERGTGQDAGRYRATFYHGRTRVRLVVDGDGRLCAPVEQGNTRTVF